MRGDAEVVKCCGGYIQLNLRLYNETAEVLRCGIDLRKARISCVIEVTHFALVRSIHNIGALHLDGVMVLVVV